MNQVTTVLQLITDLVLNNEFLRTEAQQNTLSMVHSLDLQQVQRVTSRQERKSFGFSFENLGQCLCTKNAPCFESVFI